MKKNSNILKSKYIKIIFFPLFIIILFYNIFPYFIKIKLKNIPESIIIYDTNNIEIWEIIAEDKYRHMNYKIENYPNFLKDSIVKIEDRRFYYNSWIDYISIIRALKNNLFWWNLEWASTISTQVIRNSYWLNEKRSILLKLKEFSLSLALNKKYTKDEILEYYLNNVSLWNLNYWFASASKYYFWKEINNLTKAEIISLITIIKNSNKYNPIDNQKNFRERFIHLVSYLYNKSLINEWEKENILNEKLVFQKWIKNKLPYIVDFYKNKISKNSVINSTIDYNLTKEIEKIWSSTINNLLWKNVWDYSVIIIDRKTNELKVMIWWYDYFSENWQVNWSLALRQPGSTLKPFLYSLAFKQLGLNKNSTITDLPIQFPTSDWNLYSPKNYSLDYKWEITLAESLSQSINIPAVKLLNQVWIKNFLEYLKKMWISTLKKDADFYWLSLALWSWEVSLYELTNSYSIFANDWNICNIIISKSEERKCESVIEKKYTNEVYDILSNNYFKIESFPINSNLDFSGKEIFAKTWTSRNFRDNWTIWFTNDYIIWVWAWNKDWSEMKWVSWVSWAWDIFRKIINYLDKSNKIPKKENLNITTGKNFIEITSPLEWSIYKIDNSIPRENQKINIKYNTNIHHDNVKIFINWVELIDKIINIYDYAWQNTLKVKLYEKWLEKWNVTTSFTIIN